MVKALFIGDRLEDLNLLSDTSLCLAQGCLELGIDVFWATPQQLTIFIERVVVSHPIQMGSINSNEISHSVYEENEIPLSFFSFIFLRKDPPFDQDYLSLCWVLSLSNRPCFNNPMYVAAFHEKILHFSLLNRGFLDPNDVVPTFYGRNDGLLESFMNTCDSGNGFVVKPWLGYGGRGIHHFKSKDDVRLFLNLEKNSLHSNENQQEFSKRQDYLVQPFDSKIKTHGDRRVLFVYGECVGDFTRFPQEGRFEANLAQGGKAVLQDSSKETQLLINKIGSGLKKLGIAFSGADIIGDRVNEINITSPTGLRTIEKLTKNLIGKKTIKSILTLSGILSCVSQRHLAIPDTHHVLTPFENCLLQNKVFYKGYLALTGSGSYPFELTWSNLQTSFEVTDTIGTPLYSLKWNADKLVNKEGDSHLFIEELSINSLKKMVCGGLNKGSEIVKISDSQFKGHDTLIYKNKPRKYRFEFNKTNQFLITSLSVVHYWWNIFDNTNDSVIIKGKVIDNVYMPLNIKGHFTKNWELYFINN